VKEVSEMVVTEQLLNTMPSDLRVWIREKKPVTGKEAGRSSKKGIWSGLI